MVWDYAEANPLSSVLWKLKIRSLPQLGFEGSIFSTADSARSGRSGRCNPEVSRDKFVVSTDPPYYDNIGYADLSDFFYVWLRRSLRSVFPDLFATLAVPKAEELVATPIATEARRKPRHSFSTG